MVLSICGIVVSLMQGLVMPLISSLPDLLSTSASNASWVVTATLLTAAVATPISGRLGDMFGKRRMLLILLALLSAGSLMCAVSSSVVLMIIGRALQGVAGGALPLAIGILRDELPAERLGVATAMVSATMGVGAAFGIAISALIVQATNWHALFWMSAALGIICLVPVALIVPKSPERAPGRFDMVGSLGLSAGLVALLLAISKGADWGWAGAPTLGLFAGAAIVLLGWGVMELRTADPLVDLRVSARPRVLYTNLASILAGFAMLVQMLVFIQQLMGPAEAGYGQDLSMVSAGLLMTPSGVVMLLFSPISARLSARSGPKTTLILGLSIMGAGYLLALLLGAGVWQIMLASIVIAAGLGFSYSAVPALIMSGVPQSETAAANGLNTLFRSIGTSTASAVIGAVLAAKTIDLGPATLPSQNGFNTALVIAIATSAVGVALAAMIPAGRHVQERGRGREAISAPEAADLWLGLEPEPVPVRVDRWK
jgi:MFS family permease